MTLSVVATNVGFRFDAAPILADVSFDVPPGASMALVGPSGVGKTTLLRLVAGLLGPTTGAIRLDGRKPQQLHPEQAIAFLFQRPTLWPHLTAYRTLEAMFQLHQQQPDAVRIGQLLGEVGLAEASDKFPHQLSMGMRARLAIARAFCITPRLLLMDEPFAAIDALRRPALNAALQAMRERSGCTVIWVTHYVGEAIQYADRVLTLGGVPGTSIAVHDLAGRERPRDLNAIPPELLRLRDRILHDFGASAP